MAKIKKRTKKEEDTRKFYIQQCAKMIKFEVDYEHTSIIVPYTMEEEAKKI